MDSGAVAPGASACAGASWTCCSCVAVSTGVGVADVEDAAIGPPADGLAVSDGVAKGLDWGAPDAGGTVLALPPDAADTKAAGVAFAVGKGAEGAGAAATEGAAAWPLAFGAAVVGATVAVGLAGVAGGVSVEDGGGTKLGRD